MVYTVEELNHGWHVVAKNISARSDYQAVITATGAPACTERPRRSSPRATTSGVLSEAGWKRWTAETRAASFPKIFQSISGCIAVVSSASS